ncbi:hypothetical protein [Acidovorax sp. PRC11]|uniref:hypothetical protein n=1 Tax=Acidovorax sp. PRC11 TaxID=2962592 RepID=UPI002881D5A2|nr:hypothetical protein [Acidovorax sp. PRC11]MDT0138082.1 hypothetical protein [Acidovorax sp. PRC11]
MLDDDARDWLAEELGATMELAGQQIRPAALSLLMDDLAHLPKPVLQMALARIRAEHRGPILTGTVLQYADHALGRLLPAEAYALAMSSQDERSTVVWNNEIAEAWGLAAPLLDAGDKFGARQAFMEGYARITGEARALRKRPQLQVSLGYDAEGRTRAVQEAIAAGRLPGGLEALPADVREQLALPAPRGLCALPAPAAGDSAAKAMALSQLPRLQRLVTRGLSRARRVKRVRAWQDRRRTRKLKAAAQRMVDEHLAAQASKGNA